MTKTKANPTDEQGLGGNSGSRASTEPQGRLGPLGFDPGRMECPATMCPLIAPSGSPWSGQFAAPCPGRGLSDDPEDKEGCPWWDMACGFGGIQNEVEAAARVGGAAFVVGPNQPRRLAGNSRSYDCPRASVCRWQERAEANGRSLCPPRDALSRGLDPRVCLF